MLFKIIKIRGQDLYVVSFKSSFIFTSTFIRLVIAEELNGNVSDDFSNQDCYALLNEIYKTEDVFKIYNGLYFRIENMLEMYGNNKNPACQEEEDFVVKFLKKDKNSHIVAYVEGAETQLMHELAHYLFATDESYIKICKEYYLEMSKKDISAVFQYLFSLNYSEEALADELQAHMSSDIKLCKSLGLDKKIYTKFQNNLKMYTKSIFEQIHKKDKK